MINILQTLKAMPKKRMDGNYFIVRFQDFSNFAQNKIVELIKHSSSIWTIRIDEENEKISANRIKEILEEANPVIFDCSSSYPGSPFFRWREKGLSSLIYNIWRVDDKHYKPRQNQIDHLINWLIRPENENAETKTKTENKTDLVPNIQETP